MKTSFFLSILALLTLYACESQQQESKTVAGYEVEYHVQNPLTDGRAQVGDFVTYTINISSGENQVVPEAMEQTSQINSDGSDPISQVLMTLSVDDSVSINVPLDSLPPAALEDPKITDEGIVYHIKMNEIVDEESYMLEQSKMRQAQADQKLKVDSLLDVYLEQYKNGTLEGLETTANGVEYIVLDEGTGASIEKNDQLNVHYVGRLISTGNEFDNSLERGQPLPLEVGVGSVIQGWDEGLLAFNRGDVGLLFIPSELAYGEAGSGPIPADSDLLFYVDILEK